MTKGIIIINSLAAILIYFICPEEYSRGLCIVATAIYAATFISYIIEIKMRNFFCFSFIFSVVWFFVYYLYPTIVYSINKSYYFMFAFNFNEDIMTKATYLTLIGYCAFIWGLIIQHEKPVHIRPRKREIIIESNVIPTIMVGVVCLIDFIQYIVLNQSIYFGDGVISLTATTIWGYISIFQYASLVTAMTIEFHILLRKGNGKAWYLMNPTLWILLLLDVVIVLYSGSRGRCLNIFLIALSGLAIYSGRISFLKIMGLLAAGFVLMNYVLQWRSEHSLARIAISMDILDVSSDLVINNYTLYRGYEYVQQNGFVPFTLIGSLLSAVPFLQGIVIRLFGISAYQASSAIFLTYTVLGENANVGLGTNIITSVYLASGLLGVIVFMYILGNFIGKYSKIESGYSLFNLLMYFLIMMQSIYWVRGDFFYPASKIAYSLILMWFYTVILEKKT